MPMSIYWMAALILAYFLLLMLVSSFQGKKQTNDSFFRGDRRSPWLVVAIGMVGASLSGVSFVSVPGMVRSSSMLYMQTVLGFFVGYLLIAKVLLPTYYKQNAPSIYVYLQRRFGSRSYRTGSAFFLISKLIGAAARLYVVAIILQTFIFDAFKLPFVLTVAIIILMIWLYTMRSGIKTIVWTDLLQTIALMSALVLTLVQLAKAMDLNAVETWRAISSSEYFQFFEWKDWSSKQHVVKQFFSGIFIALVMTGLDQDMMQKNLSINNLKDAQRNVYSYGFAFIPVNFLFLCLGVLLLVFAQQKGIALPAANDDILPVLATQGYLGKATAMIFLLGIVAAAFSSADSALTALTTSFCVDIVNRPQDVRLRRWVHVLISLLMLLIILVFKAVNSGSLIDAIYTIAGYTYGPLLGLFALGLCTKASINDKWTPYVAVAAPVLCAILQYVSTNYWGYVFGYELLMMNGLITFVVLWWSGKTSMCRNK